jgi:hypothetical protein
MTDRISMFATAGFSGLLQTAAFHVIEPTVVKAPEPAVLDPPVTEIRAPVGAVQSQQP